MSNPNQLTTTASRNQYHYHWQHVGKDRVLLLLLIGSAIITAWLAYLPARSIRYTMDALPVMLPLDHMHAPEHLPGWSRTFRWTTGTGQLSLANPGGQLLLRMVAGGGTDRDVPVVVRSGRLAQHGVIQAVPRTYSLLLPAASNERITLTLASPTIAQDGRTLGIMVSDIWLTGSGSGAVPMAVVWTLVAATVTLFLLLWQALGQGNHKASMPKRLLLGGQRWASTGGIIGALQVLVMVWQGAGGWRYALLGKSLLLVSSASLGAVVLQYGLHWLDKRNLHALSTRQPSSLLPPLRKLLQQRGLLVVVALALLVRLPWVIAHDPVGDLELAARRMAFLHNEGLAGAYRYDGDYMPLRLLLLWGLSHIVALFSGSFHAPLSPITLAMVKLPGMLADMATLVLLAGVAYQRQKSIPQHHHPYHWLGIVAIYACSPPVWINVAWWGQVDALLVLPLVAMVLLLDYAGGRWSWLCWTLALLIKPQAIVVAPVLYIATLRQHGSRGVAQGMAITTITFVIVAAPLVLAGQGAGLMQAYLGSVGRFPKVTIGAYNLWYLLTNGQGGNDDQTISLASLLVSYRHIGLLLVAGAALVIGMMLVWRADVLARAQAAAGLALAFFMLPTQIHERYLFLTLPFLALCIAIQPHTRFVLPYIILVATATLNILGTLDGFVPQAHRWLTTTPLPLPTLCAIANMLVLLWLIYGLIQHSVGLSYQSADHTSRQTDSGD